MRVLHLTSHLNVGGITRYVLCLSEQLIAHGHRVVIASDAGSEVVRAAALGAVHWPLPLHTSMEFSPRVLRAARELADRLAREPVDIIHAHTRVGQVVAERMTRTLGIPYVTTWHGIYKNRLGRRLWPCTGMKTIAISSLVHRSLIEQFRVPEERIHRVYNGIDVGYYAASPSADTLEMWCRHWRLPARQPVVGAIGRLAAGRVKGFDTLLVAAHLLKPTFPDLQVVIVGDGPRRPFLEDVAERLRVQDRTHFLGEIQDIRVPLACMDVFVFTSRWPEAFGLTLIEAMAAGKPIVATRAGAVPEILQHGVNGWLVPPDQPAALAEGISRLLSDPVHARDLGRQARARVHEQFTIEHMVESVEAVYRETLQASAGATPGSSKE